MEEKRRYIIILVIVGFLLGFKESVWVMRNPCRPNTERQKWGWERKA